MANRVSSPSIADVSAALVDQLVDLQQGPLEPRVILDGSSFDAELLASVHDLNACIPWQQVSFWWRRTPPGAVERNVLGILDSLGVPDDRIHLSSGNDTDLQQRAEQLIQQLSTTVRDGFDIALVCLDVAESSLCVDHHQLVVVEQQGDAHRIVLPRAVLRRSDEIWYLGGPATLAELHQQLPRGRQRTRFFA